MSNVVEFPGFMRTIPLGCLKCMNVDFFIGMHKETKQQLVFCGECGCVNGQLMDLTEPLSDLRSESK